jgi:hypothetical protein
VLYNQAVEEEREEEKIIEIEKEREKRLQRKVIEKLSRKLRTEGFSVRRLYEETHVLEEELRISLENGDKKFSVSHLLNWYEDKLDTDIFSVQENKDTPFRVFGLEKHPKDAPSYYVFYELVLNDETLAARFLSHNERVGFLNQLLHSSLDIPSTQNEFNDYKTQADIDNNPQVLTKIQWIHDSP